MLAPKSYIELICIIYIHLSLRQTVTARTRQDLSHRLSTLVHLEFYAHVRWYLALLSGHALSVATQLLWRREHLSQCRVRGSSSSMDILLRLFLRGSATSLRCCCWLPLCCCCLSLCRCLRTSSNAVAPSNATPTTAPSAAPVVAPTESPLDGYRSIPNQFQPYKPLAVLLSPNLQRHLSEAIQSINFTTHREKRRDIFG